jgi:hypothetical protein
MLPGLDTPYYLGGYLFLIVSSALTWAAPKVKQNISFYFCANKGDIRTIQHKLQLYPCS